LLKLKIAATNLPISTRTALLDIASLSNPHAILRVNDYVEGRFESRDRDNLSVLEAASGKISI